MDIIIFLHFFMIETVVEIGIVMMIAEKVVKIEIMTEIMIETMIEKEGVMIGTSAADGFNLSSELKKKQLENFFTFCFET